MASFSIGNLLPTLQHNRSPDESNRSLFLFLRYKGIYGNLGVFKFVLKPDSLLLEDPSSETKNKEYH